MENLVYNSNCCEHVLSCLNEGNIPQEVNNGTKIRNLEYLGLDARIILKGILNMCGHYWTHLTEYMGQ